MYQTNSLRLSSTSCAIDAIATCAVHAHQTLHMTHVGLFSARHDKSFLPNRPWADADVLQFVSGESELGGTDSASDTDPAYACMHSPTPRR